MMKRKQILIGILLGILSTTGICHAQSPPICCEDFTSVEPGVPDAKVDIFDLLGVLSQWGPTAMEHPSGDIAPGDAGGCPSGGNGVVDIQDLLGVLSSWGPCDSAVDTCAGVLDPANTYSRISEAGAYPFRINGILDGPQRGPTNDLVSYECGDPGSGGWAVYGTDAIDGTYVFGDTFGIDMHGPIADWIIGGDVWFHYTAPCNGTAYFSISTGGGTGELSRTLMDIFPGNSCPTDWLEFLGDYNSAFDGNPQAHMQQIVLQGETYLIRIGGWMAEKGDGVLNVSCVDNSIFEDALPMDITSFVRGSTVNANAPIAPTCNGVAVDAPGRWYSVVGDGTTLTAETYCVNNPTCFPSFHLFDSRLSVYCSVDGSAANLNCITAAQADTCDLQEEVSWCSVAGQTYYILVHGNPDLLPPFLSAGPFILSVLSDNTLCTTEQTCTPP